MDWNVNLMIELEGSKEHGRDQAEVHVMVASGDEHGVKRAEPPFEQPNKLS